MKKFAFMMLCAGSIALLSCNKTEKKETDTTVATENTGTADQEAMYRDRASEVSRQMARDLKFDADTAMQSKVSSVYYTRARRRHEARGKYSTDTTGMYAEMRAIDLEADKEFQTILKPEQYEVYEAKRTTYYGGFEETDMASSGYDSTGSTSLSAAGSSIDNSTEGMSNAKVKTKTEKDGDTKTEIEDENSETKIKTENGQTKVKVNHKN